MSRSIGRNNDIRQIRVDRDGASACTRAKLFRFPALSSRLRSNPRAVAEPHELGDGGAGGCDPVGFSRYRRRRASPPRRYAFDDRPRPDIWKPRDRRTEREGFAARPSQNQKQHHGGDNHQNQEKALHDRVPQRIEDAVAILPEEMLRFTAAFSNTLTR